MGLEIHNELKFAYSSSIKMGQTGYTLFSEKLWLLYNLDKDNVKEIIHMYVMCRHQRYNMIYQGNRLRQEVMKCTHE